VLKRHKSLYILSHEVSLVEGCGGGNLAACLKNVVRQSLKYLARYSKK
jgi:hypothetical protein